jgi:hypothetical protein
MLLDLDYDVMPNACSYSPSGTSLRGSLRGPRQNTSASTDMLYPYFVPGNNALELATSVSLLV